MICVGVGGSRQCTLSCTGARFSVDQLFYDESCIKLGLLACKLTQVLLIEFTFVTLLTSLIREVIYALAMEFSHFLTLF